MRYAKIENGVVSNVAEFDSATAALSAGYIPVPDSNGIGDGFSGGEFNKTQAPVPTITELIATAKATATQIRDELIHGGIDYLGGRFKTGVIDVAKIEGVSERYERARPGWATEADWQARHGGYWRTSDNLNHAMTLEQFHGLSDAISDQISLIEIEAHRVKGEDGGAPGLLDACTTKAEIDQVLSDFRGYLG